MPAIGPNFSAGSRWPALPMTLASRAEYRRARRRPRLDREHRGRLEDLLGRPARRCTSTRSNSGSPTSASRSTRPSRSPASAEARRSPATTSRELDAPDQQIRPELLRAAKWRAARYGLDGDLIDPWGRKTVPASRMVEALLTFLRPTPWSRSASGTRSPSLVREIVGGATVQPGSAGPFRQPGRFEDVVDLILEETSRGID